MPFGPDFREWFAGLTWPLRGRKVVMQAERTLRHEMGELRKELHILRSDVEQYRSGLRGEMEQYGNSAAAAQVAEVSRGLPSVALSEFGPLIVRSGDLIGDFLLQNRPWDQHIIPVIKEAIRPGSIAIDAGAHFGAVSVALAQYFEFVHAFEANRSTFRYLVANAAFCRPGKIVPHNVALFDRDTELSLADPKDQDWPVPAAETLEEGFERIANSGSLKFSEKGTKVNSVAATTLDAFGFKNVAFIKIDCQGADGRIVKGAQETILASRPIVVFEWEKFLAIEYGVTLEEVTALFEGWNYSVEVLHKHDLKQCDYVARPRV